jgi:hypothetical protein
LLLKLTCCMILFIFICSRLSSSNLAAARHGTSLSVHLAAVRLVGGSCCDWTSRAMWRWPVLVEQLAHSSIINTSHRLGCVVCCPAQAPRRRFTPGRVQQPCSQFSVDLEKDMITGLRFYRLLFYLMDGSLCSTIRGKIAGMESDHNMTLLHGSSSGSPSRRLVRSAPAWNFNF